MIWDKQAFDLIRRTIIAHKLHPPDYQYVLVAGHFDAPGKDFGHRHVCGDPLVRNTVNCKCDNFPWHPAIPTEELLFHGQCDDCKTVFVLQRTDGDDTTFPEFCANLRKHAGRNREKR